YKTDSTAASTLVNLLLTTVIATATVVYVHETRRMRQAETEPALAVYLAPHRAYFIIIELVIRNFGRSAPRDLQWEVDADQDDLRCHRVDLGIFHRLETLYPGEELRLWLGQAAELFKEQPLKPITVHARYRTAQN